MQAKMEIIKSYIIGSP